MEQKKTGRNRIKQNNSKRNRKKTGRNRTIVNGTEKKTGRNRTAVNGTEKIQEETEKTEQ